MKFNTLFIDLDDTVYASSSGLWELIKQRISLYMYERLNLSWDVIPELRSSYYQDYGTTMRGLIADFDINQIEYLDFVHNVPLQDHLSPDPALREMLLNLPQRKLIFTNADAAHAKRVLTAMDLTDCFEKIIDIYTMHPYCKPLKQAFQIALSEAGENETARCVLLDDSVANLAAAKELGFYTVRVGNVEESSPLFDTAIATLADLREVI